MKKRWSFIFFFLYFAGYAAFSPFLVIYFQDLAFSGMQIGLLIGIAPLVTMVTVPIWTNAADRTNRHRLVMAVSLLVTMVIVAVFPFLQNFYAVLTMVILFNMLLAPAFSLANSAAMFMLGSERDQYGRVRVGGTIGYGLAALVAGFLVERTGLAAAFWLGAAIFFIAYLSSLKLVYGQEDPGPLEKTGSILELLRRPGWILFLALAFISGVAFAVGNSYFFPYMAELGMPESAMGLALMLGTVAEIPVLLGASWFLRRYNPYGTLVIALAFTGLRLALFGLVAAPLLVMAIQLLNGLTIPLLTVAGVAYADQLSPATLRATGQGLFTAAMLGIGAAFGGFLGGLLIPAIGGQALFLTTGLATMLILALILLLRGRSPAPAQSSP